MKPEKPNVCRCPKCGYKQPRVMGIDCQTLRCPKCGTQLVGRKSSPIKPVTVK